MSILEKIKEAQKELSDIEPHEIRGQNRRELNALKVEMKKFKKSCEKIQKTIDQQKSTLKK